MRSSRWRLGLILPAGLVLLVATLAALQYRWLGQVSDAERDAMRATLERRAVEFSDDFDREITLAYSSFSSLTDTVTADHAEPIATGLARWRENARFPEIVRNVYLASLENGKPTLRRFAADRTAFDPVEWSDALLPLKYSIWPELNLPIPANGRASIVALGMPNVVVDPLAIVISVIDRKQIETHTQGTTIAPVPGQTTTVLRDVDRRGGTDMLFSMRLGHEFMVLELDKTVLSDRVLPALASVHFSSDQYRVAILDNATRPLLTTPVGNAIEPDRADLSWRFFNVRPTNVRISGDSRVLAWSTGVSASQFVTRPSSSAAEPVEKLNNRLSMVVEGSSGRGAVGTPLSPAVGFTAATLTAARPTGKWQLLLQHRAGSLANAVAQVRARNLWLSFGILSVLMAGVGLIVLNARRSEHLAAQQMDFVATVSHELRTPLAVIRSAAQNLSAGVVHDPAQAKQYGDLIESEGRRLTDMVEQVLEYAGLSGNRQNVRARPIDLGAVVQDVMSTSVTLFDSDEFTVAVEIDAQVPLVVADEGAIRRAVANLVTNAIKYGSDGRWIGVALRHVRVRGKSEVQLAVQDRGRGIEPDDLPHIFEAFYRGRYAVDRQIHGNGLGLSLVKRIVEAHGGRVSVQSTPGEGSVFTLHLPAAIPDAALPAAAEPATNPSGHTA